MQNFPEPLICKVACCFSEGGVLTLFSLFFFLNYELNLSETIFTGLTLQVIYCSETVARCNNAYVRILDKEKCYFLRWLMSGASDSGV